MADSVDASPPPVLEIIDLCAAPAEGGDDILRGLTLTVGAGEVHAVMGPNGSGKSTLANVLLGSPEYAVTGGTIRFQGDDIAEWGPDARGAAGMFLAFQYPQAISGVSVLNFLRQALSARKGIDLSMLELRLSIMEWMERLGIDPAFADRHLNDGFSGGEKKRNEILQMAILEPEVAILDETDSGLDIDALRTVARGVEEVRADRPELGCLVITHYQRLLDELKPDAVHLLIDGSIVKSGGPELSGELESEGYAEWKTFGMSTTADLGATAQRAGSLDVATIRRDFPILDKEIGGKRLVFLDSAASAQKPRSVMDAMTEFAESDYANVHRGVYALAERSTARLEAARAAVARFIGASSADEVVFTKNATEGLNLVAGTWGRANLGPGDAVVVSQMEHHSNIVPWFQLQAEKGFEIRWIPVGADHMLDLSELDRLLDGAKMVAVTAMSNVLGALPPVREIADAAHAAGALVSVDACQYVPHLATDVVAMGADFAAFSGHKMVGPTGIGVLWGRAELLDAIPPFLGGGGMILTVDLDGFTPAAAPAKFEAGTPPIIEAVGLHAAIDYLENLGMEAVRAHEVSLTAYAMRTLTERVGDRLTIHGPSEPAQRGGVLSLAIDDVHPHDLAQVMDEHAVCVRPGHHCAKPLMKVLGVGATARASFYIYNDTDDVDALADALIDAADFFTR